MNSAPTPTCPPEIAECIAGHAEEELSEDARAFLIASMQKDDARTSQLRQSMPLDELAAAGMFMVSASSRCGAPID